MSRSLTCSGWEWSLDELECGGQRGHLPAASLSIRLRRMEDRGFRLQVGELERTSRELECLLY